MYAAGRAIVSAALLVMSRAPVRAAAAEAALAMCVAAGCLAAWLAGGCWWLALAASYDCTRSSLLRIHPAVALLYEVFAWFLRRCAGQPKSSIYLFMFITPKPRAPGPNFTMGRSLPAGTPPDY